MEPYLHSANTPSWRGVQLKAQGQLYLYLTAFRTALRPTQPPIQWVPESGPGVKQTTHLHLVPWSKNEWSYTSTPNSPSWLGARLKYGNNFTFTHSEMRISA